MSEEWLSVADIRAAQARSSEEGLPDNHVVTIVERTLTVDIPELIQNNIKTDTVTLELDSEWDGISPVIIFECTDANYQVAYTGEPVHIPQAVMLKIDRIGCSVCGYDDTGEVRLVTKAAPSTFRVVESGSFIGEVSEDDVSLLGQILAAADAANAAADKVENASFAATATTLEPGESATAQITGDDLKMTVAFGIPKGEKGDKGDPGEQGIQGIPGVDGQDGAPGADGFSPTVEVSKAGSVTTISITDKTGLKTAQINDGVQGPPGEKGDPGADGTNGQNGADGFSPTVEVSKSGTVTTISITDKTGVKTAEISDGAKGDKGEKGDPGDKGDPGEQGDPGTAATIAVGSVTGLDAGASPTVVNSGTANAARFDFGIPKGDKGDKGNPGDDGYTPQRGVDYWTAEDVEAVVEDAKAQAVAELAEIGNVPKRTVTDLVAHGEDAYAQKPIEVRVKGRTIKNLWPYEATYEESGVNMTMDKTGLITLTGTASTDVYITIGNASGVAANKSYTLAVSNLPSGVSVLADSYRSEHMWLSSITVQSGTTATGATHADMAELRCMIKIASGTTVNASFRVMLVEGSEAPDCFTPPASITSVQTGNLVTAGKNLLSDAILQQVAAGQSNYIEYADGVMTVNADNGAAWSRLPAVMTVPPGDYVASFAGSGGKVDVGNGANKIADSYGTNFVHFSLEVETSLSFKFTSADAATFPVTITNIQLELGSTATAYEPPNVTTTPLPEVELRSLPNGTCDELVIKADGTCEVERQTQLVDGEVVALDTPTTEPQSPVTLPQLPAPTFNAYHDSQVPSDTSVTYARDVNIVLANLEAVQTALLGGE